MTPPARPLLIAIPFYRNEALVDRLLTRLLDCAAEIEAVGGRVVCYDDSPDYAPLGEALRRAETAARGRLDLTVHRNDRNLGFVSTCNQAFASAAASGQHLLLLNSDTRPEPGAFAEMAAVAAADPMTGFVNPRSDNATIATLPIAGRLQGGQDATYLEKARAFAALLPRSRLVPTGVGFALWIRWEVVAEFGGFDPVYSPGYNEENDLIMRAARCGWRVRQANRAFVWHDGEQSFGTAKTTRDMLEARNRAVLDARYPEYGRYTHDFCFSPSTVAEDLVAALVPGPDGRRDIVLDFSSFRADHNGTFAAGRQLLAAAPQVWGDGYRTLVRCDEAVWQFHQLEGLGAERIDTHTPHRGAVVFRTGQPYDWNAVERFAVGGAVAAIAMLDTISLDCPQLVSPFLEQLWRVVVSECDVLVTQSDHTLQQIQSRLPVPERVVRCVSRHSLDFGDYGASETAPAARGSILVIGNHFPHKRLEATVLALAERFPGERIEALGLADTKAWPANVTPHAAGLLDHAAIDALYLGARVVVFPSQAEGFGFPVLDALARRRPVFVRRLPVFEEVAAALGHPANLHFFDALPDLLDRLGASSPWREDGKRGIAGDRMRPPAELRDAFEQALRTISHDRIVTRLNTVTAVGAIGTAAAPRLRPMTRAEDAARLLALRIEQAARRAFDVAPLYYGVRSAVRLRRAVRRIFT